MNMNTTFRTFVLSRAARFNGRGMLRIVRTFVQEWFLQALGELLLDATNLPAESVGLLKLASCILKHRDKTSSLQCLLSSTFEGRCHV